MKRKITVGIIEDDEELAKTFQSEINKTEGYSCDHIFSTAETAITHIPKLDLDVVLTDIGLPNISGISCIAYLKTQFPQIEFLIITAFEDTQSVFEALKAGASGYMTKADSIPNILAAITDVHRGGSPMSSLIARKVVSHFQLRKPTPELAKLSLRELEIVEHLAKGFRYKEIGDLLHISIETVRTHIRNIYQKLQVSSRTDALNKVYRK